MTGIISYAMKTGGDPLLLLKFSCLLSVAGDMPHG